MLPSSLAEIHPFVLALFVLAFGFSLRRVALRKLRNRRRSDAVADAKQMLARHQEAPNAQMKKHEVELHNVARETEARLQTQMAVMDQMVTQADREIARLEELLNEIRQIPTPRLAGTDPIESSGETNTGSFESPGHPRTGSFASPNDTESDPRDVPDVNPDQFIRLLRQAGYNAEEIATATKRPLAEVRRILGEPDEGSSRAA